MVFFENFGWLLVLIGVMIIIHELGHYWAARFFDVRVDTFSFGFGPRLFGFKKGETDFRFSLILFGGYVKMAGEHPTDEVDPRGFLAKPKWQRLIIVFAGPAMNIILAVGLLTSLYMTHYPKIASSTSKAVIGYVQPDSPAAKAGLKDGDHIIQIDDQQDPLWEDVMLKEVASANRELPLLVDRSGQRLRFVVTPNLDARSGVGMAGWTEQTEVEIQGVVDGMDAQKKGLRRGDVIQAIDGRPVRTVYKVHEIIRASNGAPIKVDVLRNGKPETASVQPSFSDSDGTARWMIGVQLGPRVIYTRLGLVDAVQESCKQNVKGATLIYQFLRGIIERRMSPKSLEGPIRIAQLSGEAAREGPSAFIGLMSTVSLNLAIFNLLPIPILDGGVILLLLIEMLIRRDLSMNLKEAVFKLGFVFLMMVVVFVLYNDLSKILQLS
jgi:regulator of sigma E protease